jgi:hypothetical protein
MPTPMQPTAGPIRATRLNVAAQLVYRRVGDDCWGSGHTVNVSRTGVLFVAGGPRLAPGTEVEFVLDVSKFGLHAESRAHCLGRIVRCCTDPRSPVAMAATIDASRLIRDAAEMRGAAAVDD